MACNYGRACGVLTVDGEDVGDTLMSENLAPLRGEACVWAADESGAMPRLYSLAVPDRRRRTLCKASRNTKVASSQKPPRIQGLNRSATVNQDT
jgi:hypothetical protein